MVRLATIFDTFLVEWWRGGGTLVVRDVKEVGCANKGEGRDGTVDSNRSKRCAASSEIGTEWTASSEKSLAHAELMSGGAQFKGGAAVWRSRGSRGVEWCWG